MQLAELKLFNNSEKRLCYGSFSAYQESDKNNVVDIFHRSLLKLQLKKCGGFQLPFRRNVRLRNRQMPGQFGSLSLSALNLVF